MQTFIVNLERDVQKLQSTLTCLSSLHIRDEDIINIAATDGNALTSEEMKQLCGGKSWLTRAMIGCADSHMRIWKMLLDSEEEQIFIVEDDIFSPSGSFDIQPLFAEHLPEKEIADILYLGYIRSTINYFGLKKWHDSNWVHFEYPLALCAYLITREGAQKMLDYIQSKGGIFAPVDQMMVSAMRSEQIRSLIHVPSLLYQSSNSCMMTNTVSSINDHSYPTCTKRIFDKIEGKRKNMFEPLLDMSYQSILGIKLFQIHDYIQFSVLDAFIFMFGFVISFFLRSLFLIFLTILLLLLGVDFTKYPIQVLTSLTCFGLGFLFGATLKQLGKNLYNTVSK